MVPAELRYTKDHEWIRVEGDEAVVGITQYAADQLGDIVFVELPDAGRSLEPARDVRRRRVGQGRERPVRAGRRRGDRDQRRPHGVARARQHRPLRRGLDAPRQARGPGRRWTPSSTPRAYEQLTAGG